MLLHCLSERALFYQMRLFFFKSLLNRSNRWPHYSTLTAFYFKGKLIWIVLCASKKMLRLFCRLGGHIWCSEKVNCFGYCLISAVWWGIYVSTMDMRRWKFRLDFRRITPNTPLKLSHYCDGDQLWENAATNFIFETTEPRVSPTTSTMSCTFKLWLTNTLFDFFKCFGYKDCNWASTNSLNHFFLIAFFGAEPHNIHEAYLRFESCFYRRNSAWWATEIYYFPNSKFDIDGKTVITRMKIFYWSLRLTVHFNHFNFYSLMIDRHIHAVLSIRACAKNECH